MACRLDANNVSTMCKYLSLVLILTLIGCSATKSMPGTQSSPLGGAEAFNHSNLIEFSDKRDYYSSVLADVPKLLWTSNPDYIVVSTPGDYTEDGRPTIEAVSLIDGYRCLLAIGIRANVSPDGRLLAYFSDDNRLFVMKLSSCSSDQGIIAEYVDTGLESHDFLFANQPILDWSSDSTKIVFLRVNEDLDNGVGQSRTGVKKYEIKVLDLPSDASRTVYESKEPLAFVVYRDTNNIITHSKTTDQHWTNRDGNRLIEIDIRTGAQRALTNNVGPFPASIMPSVSNNGESVSFNLDAFYEKRFQTSFGWNTAIYDANKQEVSSATSDYIMASVRHLAFWTADDRAIIYPCKGRVLYSSLCRTNLSSGETHSFEISPTREILFVDSNSRNDRIAIISLDAYHTVHAEVYDQNGKLMSKILEWPIPSRSTFQFSDIEVFEWMTADGFKLGGLLVRPTNYKEGTTYPLIVDIHGGPYGGVRPRGSILQNTPLEWQVWASKGYAVFVADYRSAAVLGTNEELFRRPIDRALHDNDVDDILAGIEALISKGIVDRDRLAIVSQSYGAILANWLVTKTDMFRAVVSIEGLHSYHPGAKIESALFAPLPKDYRQWLFRANEDNYNSVTIASSPATYVNRIKTPMLIVSAGKGAGGSDGEYVADFVTAIAKNDVHVEHLHFDEEHHRIKSEQAISVLWRRIEEFIRIHFERESKTKAKSQ